VLDTGMTRARYTERLVAAATRITAEPSAFEEG
jgi:hypothetical protein